MRTNGWMPVRPAMTARSPTSHEAGEPRVVDHDHVVADLAVVGDVALAMRRQSVADHRPALLRRRAVDGRVLADHGVGADPHARRRARLAT